MTSSERSALVRRNRPRGVYVPVIEAQVYIELAGWRLLDDWPAGVDGKARDECLLLPPSFDEQAA